MGFRRNQRRRNGQTAEPAAEKAEVRMDRKTEKVDLKITRSDAKRQLIDAKARRLKWLVILIGIGLVAYFTLAGGGLSKLGGIFKTFNFGN